MFQIRMHTKKHTKSFDNRIIMTRQVAHIFLIPKSCSTLPTVMKTGNDESDYRSEKTMNFYFSTFN